MLLVPAPGGGWGSSSHWLPARRRCRFRPGPAPTPARQCDQVQRRCWASWRPPHRAERGRFVLGPQSE